MPAFPVNSSRRDPYKNYNFRVSFEGRYVAGATNVSGLSDGHKQSDPLTFERGVTHDAEFEAWASSAVARQGSPSDDRRDIVIELLDETGEPVCAYKILNCWVSKLTAISGLDGDKGVVSIESLTLENEGWKQTFDSATNTQSYEIAPGTNSPAQGES